MFLEINTIQLFMTYDKLSTKLFDNTHKYKVYAVIPSFNSLKYVHGNKCNLAIHDLL